MPRKPKGRTRRPVVSEKVAELAQEKNEWPRVPIVVLFADIEGCSEISNHKSIADYNVFLRNFRTCFFDTCKKYKQAWIPEKAHEYFNYGVRGDEGNIMIFPKEPDIPANVDIAVNFALDLKSRWLLTDENKRRIEDNLLPIDLAVGIHIGKAWVNETTVKTEAGEFKYRPEGYAVNLCKRIEGASRDGRFTKILLSEAAKGQLDRLTNEFTYSFAEPHSVKLKGIARPIVGYELKHHFLATDWNQEKDIAGKKEPRSRGKSPRADREQLKVLKGAFDANPSSLYLAEELITLYAAYDFDRLQNEEKEEDSKALSKAYKEAFVIAKQLNESDHRDEWTLAIMGFLYGERREYVNEQKCYNEALEIKRFAYGFWYCALSRSYELYYRHNFDESRTASKIKKAREKDAEEIKNMFNNFKEALDLKPHQAWIRYDYGCELCCWGDRQAESQVLAAVEECQEIEHYISKEKYLKPILNRLRMQLELG